MSYQKLAHAHASGTPQDLNLIMALHQHLVEYDFGQVMFHCRTFRCKHRIPSDLQTLDGRERKLNNVIYWKVWCQQKKSRQ